MMKDEWRLLVDHARQFLDSARENLNKAPERNHVAFDEARTAAELVGKALLSRKLGSYPRRHNIGGPLFQEGLLPNGVDPKQVAHLLREHTRGNYGFDTQIGEDDIALAIEIAQALLDACDS